MNRDTVSLHHPWRTGDAAADGFATGRATAQAMPDEERRMIPEQASPGRSLNGDHLVAVRHAVADFQRSLGFPELAARIRAGEGDRLPLMQAAIVGAETVLRGLFDG